MGNDTKNEMKDVYRDFIILFLILLPLDIDGLLPRDCTVKCESVLMGGA